jgi:GTP cyclohydrolase I
MEVEDQSLSAEEELFEGCLEFVRLLMQQRGEDPKREGLRETPQRFLKALDFWMSGYRQRPQDVLKLFEDGATGYDTMVFQANLPVWSTCEHHLAPFFGLAHVAYIPNKRIIGLSKIARVVDIFARRLQVQERLGSQIADCFMEHLEPEGVGVVLQCRHSCMESRGVQKAGTVTLTSALRGSLKDQPEVRAEFMALVNASVERTVL